MTIAIALKIGDGLVLGADSASTLVGPAGVVNVYFNAEKIMNLRKGLPVGAVTYGLGNLASRSMTSLAKDLRRRFSDDAAPWHLSVSSYSMEEVADKVRKFFYEELYCKEYPQKVAGPDGGVTEQHAPFGFLIAGYSANATEGEIWQVAVDPKGDCTVRQICGLGGYGIVAEGQPEVFQRLAFGYSPGILNGLVNSGIPLAEAQQFLKMNGEIQLAQQGMPLQDAIDLVRFLSETTAGFVRFIPGAPTVHPPIDLAAISYHEGFRWVQRKHYYSADLNPPIFGSSHVSAPPPGKGD